MQHGLITGSQGLRSAMEQSVVRGQSRYMVWSRHDDEHHTNSTLSSTSGVLVDTSGTLSPSDGRYLPASKVSLKRCHYGPLAPAQHIHPPPLGNSNGFTWASWSKMWSNDQGLVHGYKYIAPLSGTINSLVQAARAR